MFLHCNGWRPDYPSIRFRRSHISRERRHHGGVRWEECQARTSKAVLGSCGWRGRLKPAVEGSGCPENETKRLKRPMIKTSIAKVRSSVTAVPWKENFPEINLATVNLSSRIYPNSPNFYCPALQSTYIKRYAQTGLAQHRP